MKMLQVGIMGCANIADRMVLPAMKESASFNIVAVASRNLEKARGFAAKFGCEAIEGYDRLIERGDIDMIYMPLPTALHLEFGVRSLNAGKHVLLEKSLACNLQEARQIVNAARSNHRLVQENFMFRYHRQFAIIQELVNSGRLGDIRCIRASFGFPAFPDSSNIRYQRELGGGALLDAGAYTLKIAQLLLGYDLEVGGAVMNIDPEKGVDTRGAIFLHDRNGVVVETAFGFDHFYQCNLEIWGNRGRLFADRIFTSPPGHSPKLIVEEQGKSEVIQVEPDNHFLRLLEDFYRTVETNDFEEKYEEVLNQSALLQQTIEKAVKP